MAYDEALAGRVREVLGERAAFAEIRMFGGLCFTVRGNMAVGVVGDELMVRIGPKAHEQALKRPGARPMDFTGRPMKGYLFVGNEGMGTKRALGGWVDRALAFTETLPAKQANKRRPPVRPRTSAPRR